MQRLRILLPIHGLVARPSRPCRPCPAPACPDVAVRTFSRIRPRGAASNDFQTPHPPPFEVPLAILDLDAENSPHVRAYNASDEKAQTHSWNQNPQFDALMGRIESFRSALRHREGLWHRNPRQFDEGLVTERDIFQVALLGPPKHDMATQVEVDAEHTGDGRLEPRRVASNELLARNSLRSIGLSDPLIDDELQIVRLLLHRLAQSNLNVPEEIEGEHQASYNNGRKKFSRMIKTSTFPEIRRLLNSLSRHEMGRLLAAEFGPQLERACMAKSHFTDGRHKTRVKSLRNNLAINFVDYDPSLSKRKKEPAAAARLLPAKGSVQSRQPDIEPKQPISRHMAEGWQKARPPWQKRSRMNTQRAIKEGRREGWGVWRWDMRGY